MGMKNILEVIVLGTFSVSEFEFLKETQIS